MRESAEEIICRICDAEIVQYFNENYQGQRGKCTTCGIDFPLEWSEHSEKAVTPLDRMGIV